MKPQSLEYGGPSVKRPKRKPLRIRKRSAATIAAARMLRQEREQQRQVRERSQAYLDRLYSGAPLPPA